MPDWAAERVLLIGGTSEIGLAIVRRLADRGPVRPVLLGRDAEGMRRALTSLEAAAGCRDGVVIQLDAGELDRHEQVVAEAFAVAGGIDTVVLAAGVLGAQAGLDADRADALEVMQVNFVGAGSLLMAALKALRAQGRGTLVLLSSITVERPRAANAIYCAAKTGLDALAQGLADSIGGSGVRVLVMRPGFVHTKMTAGLPAPPLSTTAEAVAEATLKALDGSAHTVWTPRLLRPLFVLLRLVPRAIWRRLPL